MSKLARAAVSVVLVIATGCPPALARDCPEIPIPAMRASIENDNYVAYPVWEAGADLFSAGVGSTPLGKGPALAYDFATVYRDTGGYALDRENAAMKLEYVLWKADTDILHQFHAQHISLRTDKYAIAISNDLVLLANEMYAGNQTQAYLSRTIGKHFSYAITRAGPKFVVNKALEYLLTRDVVLKPIAQEMRALGVTGELDGKIASVLHATGWKRLPARSNASADAIGKLMAVVLGATAVEHYYSEAIQAAGCSALDDLYAEIMAKHAARYRPQTVSLSAQATALREQIAARPQALAPAINEAFGVMASAAAPAAAPIASVAAYMPPSAPLVRASAQDAVAEAIGNEDSVVGYVGARGLLVHAALSFLATPAHAPARIRTPPVPPAPAPAVPVTVDPVFQARWRQLRADMLCQGVRNCNNKSWDGRGDLYH